MYFPVIPFLTHVVGSDNEIYIRVNAIQELTGAFVVLEIPATIGPINNVWDQLPGYHMYNVNYVQPPVELDMIRSGSIIETSMYVHYCSTPT